MKTRHAITLLAAAAALAAGCGNEDDEQAGAGTAANAKPAAVSVEERKAQLDSDPYDVRCSDIRNERYTDLTRRVQNALADDAKISGLNRLQASQSIYYAMTELCKGRPGTHEPADEAIAGVRSGKYRAEL